MITQNATAVLSQQPTPELTSRQRLLVQGLVEGKSVSDANAALGAFAYARPAAYRALDDVREKLPQIMDDCGLDVHSLMARLREKLDARETKFFQKDGCVVETRDVEAHGVQMAALELATDLRGLKQRDSSTSIGTVNILWAGATPAWAQPATATVLDSNSNATVQQQLPDGTGVPISTIEGTGPEAGPSTHTHPTVSERVTKAKVKRKPRLPVYRGER